MYRKPCACASPAFATATLWYAAGSWCSKTLLWWVVNQALQALSPPADGLLSLVGDSTSKGKRGRKHPVASSTRLSWHPPSVFGLRIVILMAPRGVYRIPVDVALLRYKDDSKALGALVRSTSIVQPT